MFLDDPRQILCIDHWFYRAKNWALENTEDNYESYRAIRSNLESLSSISQVTLMPLENQTHNYEAMFQDVKENLVVDCVESSAQVQKDKNTNLISATDVSCNVIVYGGDGSLREWCAR